MPRSFDPRTQLNRKKAMADLSVLQGRADTAAFFEAWVGMTLSRAGLYTMHSPFTVAAGIQDVGELNQGHDLEVSRDRANWRVAEVKSQSKTFHGPHDYPNYGKELMFVCSMNNWIRRYPGERVTPVDFLFISRYTGSIVWLPTGSPVELGLEIYDPDRGSSFKTAQSNVSNLRYLHDYCESF